MGVNRIGATARLVVAASLSLASCRTTLPPYQPRPDRDAGVGNMDGASAERLQATLDRSVQRLDLPGLQATIRLGDGRTWTGVSGTADADRKFPLRQNAAFRVGSLTKLYTATLVLLLVDEGRLSLDDTIANWLPGYPNASRIAIRQLLSHRSGAAELLTSTWVKVRSSFAATTWKPEELVAAAAGLDPSAAGEGFAYSNTNYVLLGVICERVTGKSLAGLLRERIADPLRLQATRLVPYDPPPAGLTTGFDRDMLPLPGLYRLEPGDASWATVAYAAGALVSTTEELVRFLDALVDHRILSARSLEDMLSFQEAPMAGRPEQRGYGLGISRVEVAGLEHWGHAGLFIGSSAIALHAPGCGLTVAVAGNLSTFDVVSVAAELEHAAGNCALE